MHASIVIDKTEIHQINRLYCLNDIHAASPFADDPNKRPSQWARRKQTKALAAAVEAGDLSAKTRLENDLFEDDFKAIRKVKGGGSPGIYTTEDLAIAYAMWLSAEFHLLVIRVFRAATTKAATAGAYARAVHDLESWQDARVTGKLAHGVEIAYLHELLQLIKESNPGSSYLNDSPTHNIYITYARMVKSVVGVNWSARDELSVDFLDIVKAIEKGCARIIKSGIDNEADYHDIFSECREKAATVFSAMDGGSVDALVEMQLSLGAPGQ